MLRVVPAMMTGGRRSGNGVPGGDAIRWTRVRTARERIESGYYEREDVQHLVLNALMNEMRDH